MLKYARDMSDSGRETLHDEEARTMAIIDPPGARSILAIAAHPDDIEAWCAGTIARAIDGGATARLLLVTSGDKGSGDPTADARAVAIRREAEAKEAARLLGITDVAFLRYTDGEVENTQPLVRDLVGALRRWQPDVVFTFDPEHPLPPYISHRDHRTVGRATLDAIYPLARDPLAFPQYLRDGLRTHKVGAVWLFASAVADAYVDISATFARKVAARLAHASQTADPAALPERFRARDSAAGAPVGLPLAEAFTIVTIGR
ncbi:MAG: PIG-L family deacetylase [Thermomicrobia bacterium]|nr:PIG-L family deacetylase [Thermomicrobia bacterium]MCA1722949.1 PIG-L family deacetylase [Thermomicrobia bacterium]